MKRQNSQAGKTKTAAEKAARHAHKTGKFHLDKKAHQLLAAPAAEGHDDDLLMTPEAARVLTVSTQWLEIGRSKGYGPPYERLGPGIIRYRRATLRQWLKERQHTCTAEYKSPKTGVGA